MPLLDQAQLDGIVGRNHVEGSFVIEIVPLCHLELGEGDQVLDSDLWRHAGQIQRDVLAGLHRRRVGYMPWTFARSVASRFPHKSLNEVVEHWRDVPPLGRDGAPDVLDDARLDESVDV